MSTFHWAKTTDARWYLAVRCEKCALPILFALDHSEGAKDDRPAAKLVLTCSVDECKHKADYTTAAVLRFQKQPAAANQTRRNHENRKSR